MHNAAQWSARQTGEQQIKVRVNHRPVYIDDTIEMVHTYPFLTILSMLALTAYLKTRAHVCESSA
jgi:hypothetical protein